MNLKKMIADAIAKSQQLVAEVETIVTLADSEKRPLNKTEQDRIDAINGTAKATGEIEAVNAEITRLEKMAAINEQVLNRIAPTMQNMGNGDSDAPVIRIPARARQTGSLKAFKGATAEADAYTAGRFVMAVIGNHQPSVQWCRDHGVIRNAMGENDDLKGGVMVPHQMESAIINLKEMYGVFGQNVRTVPMTSDTMSIPRRLSGVTAYAVTEAQEITASDATMNQVSLTARKFATLTRISSELNEDAIISIADFIADEIAYAHAVKEDACGFLGDGTTTYHGIMGLANVLAAGSVATAGAGLDTDAELTIAVFQLAVSKLPQYPGIAPKWFVNSAVYHNVMGRLQMAMGGNTVTDLGNGPTLQFLGYPVVFVQTLPNAVTAASKFAYFGDLRMAATKGNRRGVTIAADASRYFEYDQTAIRSTLRYDINIHEIGTASVAGPIVQLAAP